MANKLDLIIEKIESDAPNGDLLIENLDRIKVFVDDIIDSIGNITKWVQFTPALNSGVNVSNNFGYWRRLGDTIEVKGYVAYSGAGNNSDFTAELPNNLSFDTTKLPHSIYTSAGTVAWHDNGVNTRVGSLQVSGDNKVTFILDSANVNWQSDDAAANDYVSYSYSLPISGWVVKE